MNASTNQQIPVVDVDQAFPAMVDRPAPSSDGNGAAGDVTPQVSTAVRDVLGMRPRIQDPKAFLDALRASFNLRLVQGHVVADYVPRGAAVMSDLGAVTGGQASLYRRATMARAEILRILDGLTPLRPDADPDDMASYRTLVRDSVQRLVDELGNPGGPRVQMVDMYLAGLTGAARPVRGVDADSVGGQLGALRDRFGLTDDYSNTVDDEAVRTSFWTMVDLVTDLQTSWHQQRRHFTTQAGQGFLGTDLILLSRLMEASADQVDELERVLASVLIPETERRTIILERNSGLTLDGLLTWLRGFVGDEGRRIAQDTGRDGIVSALAPMAVEVVRTFRRVLADKIENDWQHHHTGLGGQQSGQGVTDDGWDWPVLYLPVSCCAALPAGLYSARVRVAVASLCRLLTELARTAQRIGRFSRPIALDVTFRPVLARPHVVEVDVRGINLRPTHIPAFYVGQWAPDDCELDQVDRDRLVLPLRGSSTADDDSVVGFFDLSDLQRLFTTPPDSSSGGQTANGQVDQQADLEATKAMWATISSTGGELVGGITTPAEVWPLLIIDGETGRPVMSPMSESYPQGLSTLEPVSVNRLTPQDWDSIPGNERFRRNTDRPAYRGPQYPRTVPTTGGGILDTPSGAEPPSTESLVALRQLLDSSDAAAKGDMLQRAKLAGVRIMRDHSNHQN